MIYEGSRYQRATVAAVPSDHGWAPTVFRDIPSEVLPTRQVVMSDHETLQDIAYRAYGDPELWWHIADNNPDVLYPDNIPAGTVLRIPNASTLR